VIAALTEQLQKGTSFGAPCALENVLAEKVIQAVPSVEMVRFVNSGTEAAMSALRVARAATGRELVIKFEGGYHGHADSLLVEAGSGVATLSIPGSAGVARSVAAQTLVATYNELSSVEALIEAHRDQVAGVIVALKAAIQQGQLSMDQVNQSVQRILLMKMQYGIMK